MFLAISFKVFISFLNVPPSQTDKQIGSRDSLLTSDSILSGAIKYAIIVWTYILKAAGF